MLTGLLLTAVPFTFPACERRAPDRTNEKARIEAAVLRWERETSSFANRAWQVRCFPMEAVFRSHPVFGCGIRRAHSSGIDGGCFALVGKALYGVGGCYDPLRDGKTRLLSPGHGS
jgi:hypothetical protein